MTVLTAGDDVGAPLSVQRVPPGFQADLNGMVEVVVLTVEDQL